MTQKIFGQGSLLTTPVAILLVGILIAAVLYINANGFSLPPSNPTTQPEVAGVVADTRETPPAAPETNQTAGNVPKVTANDHVRGNPNAFLALIEYSDLECPFCKRFHPTAQRIVDEYPDQVMWVYRHFPLDQLHSKARKEAEATECATELGGHEAFWQLTDEIFRVTPSNNGLDLNELPNLAVRIGLDREQFQACLDSGRQAERVESDYQGGLQSGVTGTPGNILLDLRRGETRLIPGALPFEQFTPLINEMLAG